ncbi:MAG TPA: hypothetical protein VFT48_05730 [Pyrinomonadaceae bacterium]|nr:hypothetical protein [Pyrinomonadaceae bacterium]
MHRSDVPESIQFISIGKYEAAISQYYKDSSFAGIRHEPQASAAPYATRSFK